MKIIWTYEKCKEEALKYNTRTNFSRGTSRAYEIARKNNWLDEICSHMDVELTKEMCRVEALNYNNIGEFITKCRHVYYISNKNGWLSEICSHMKRNKSRNYWTKEKCHIEALKFKHRYEFQLNSNGAYRNALKNNWLDEICSHMKMTGNWYKRCIYVYEFPDNCAYIGLTYKLFERNLNRRKNKNDAVTKHINLTHLKPTLRQLTDYIFVDIASSLEIHYINEYKKNGWNVLNIAKGGTVGNCIRIWTYEKCKNLASKYNTRNEFKKNNRSAYESARINKWLNEICIHMKSLR